MKTTDRITIEDVARRLGLPVRFERIPCPRHPREAPAAILDTRAQRYRCPRCRDVEGGVVDLVVAVKGIDRAAARRWLAREDDDEVALVLEAVLREGVSSGRAFEEARRRLGVSRETLARFGARFVADYRGVMLRLRERFPLELLRRGGVFNRRDHLVFYRHRLVVPFQEEGRLVHLVGLGPGELHLVGRPVPVPFHVEALERERGEIVLTASVADALALEDWGAPAVAVPEPPGLREAWRERFHGCRVLVLEDPATGGRRGAEDRAAALRGIAGSVEIVRMPGGGRAASVLGELARGGAR